MKTQSINRQANLVFAIVISIFIAIVIYVINRPDIIINL
jgi:hypothetical protein